MSKKAKYDTPPPKADPEIGKQAIEDAKKIKRENESSVQPVYKTQGKGGGENKHHSKETIISEFDDPAGNTA